MPMLVPSLKSYAYKITIFYNKDVTFLIIENIVKMYY